MTLGWAAELLSFMCVLACRLGGLHVSHTGARDQVWWGSISTGSEIGKPNLCVHVFGDVDGVWLGLLTHTPEIRLSLIHI